MNPESSRAGLAPPLAEWMAAALAILGGGLILVGWAFDLDSLKSILPGWIAAKPNTALAFVLIGVALGCSGRSSRRGSVLARGCGWLAGLLGLLTLAEYALDWNAGFDQWLFREPPGAVGTSHAGRMAPDTALCFVLLAVGLETARRSRKAAGMFFATVLLGALVTVVAVVEILICFTPALRTYGWGGLTMMALPTAALFAALGVAVGLAGLRENRAEAVAVAQPTATSESRAGLAYLLAFMLLAVGIVAITGFYYRHYERKFQTEIEHQLAAIADLKVSQLVQYRNERLAAAKILFENPSFAILVRRFLELPDDADARRQLQGWLDKYAGDFRYDQAHLLDPQGVTRLAAPADMPPVSATVAAEAADALRTRRVMLQDFYRNEHDQRVYLGVLIPVFAESDASRPLGVIFLRIDPEAYLYPFISRWPTPSPTAETLLVRREGNDTVFLNELRFQKDTALKLRAPVDSAELPAARAALGRDGIMAGIDYRGVPVVAATRNIPDSPWSLVARMDASEVYAPLRAQLWQLIAAGGMLLFGAGAGVGGIWWQQQARFVLAQAHAATEIHQLNLTLEQRVVERTAQLEASSREMAAFSYSVAHDLRSPLRAMDGFSAALLEDCADRLDGASLDYLRRIRAASQRMAVLIDDLLDLSRESRAEMQREPVDLTALAWGIIADLRRAHPEHQPEWVVAPALAANADPRMVRVVLTNLLGNAWKFTGQRAGARIEVGTLAPEEEAAHLLPPGRPELAATVFFVRDNGAGFDMAYAAKLFGAFQRLHSQQEFAGTGIGLALVQRIIHRHGGQVWCDARINEGATFFFSLG